MKQFLILLMVFCTVSLFPVNNGLKKTESTSSEDQALFSVNMLKNKTDKVILKNIFILESEFEENRYILGSLRESGFREYDGNGLKHEKKVKKRMYTFRTGFYIAESLKDERLSIYVPLTCFPRNIYLNGIKIITAGKYQNGYITSAYLPYNIYLSPDILHYGDTVNEFAFQVYPEHDQSALGKLTLSSYEDNALSVFLQTFLGMSLIQTGCVVSLIIFFYLLFLFFIIGAKQYYYLYFSFTCFAFCFSYINMCLSSDGISQIIIEKISRASFPWLLMFVFFFILEFTGMLKKSWLLKSGIALAAIILTVLTIIQKTMHGVASFFTITMFGFIAPLLLFSIVILIISLLRDKNRKAIVILVSFGIVIISAIHDIGYVMSTDIPYSYTMQYGFLSMVLSVFFLLAYDQSVIFMNSIKTAKDLDIKNKSLNRMLDNIQLVSKNLNVSSSKLNDIVSTSSSVIKEFEASNSTIIASVISRLTDVDSLIRQVGVRVQKSTDTIPKAILNQTAIVEEVSATILNMNAHMEKTQNHSEESNTLAQHLASVAERSRDMISESKNAISMIFEYSRFLNEVLVAIEDITDKTNILSINAAIEAARQGASGKGFSIIAGEIGSLSSRSKGTLESSFEKIKGMYEIIEKSTKISDDVSTGLFSIIGEIKESSRMINTITELVQEQKKQTSEILISVENLLSDTTTIKDLSEEEMGENLKIKGTLSQLKRTFSSITDLLKGQMEKGNELSAHISSIEFITGETMQDVEILRKTTILGET